MTIDSIRADIARLEAERDQLLTVARHCPSCGFTYVHEGEGLEYVTALETERDSLKAKLAEAEGRVQTALVNATEARGKSRTAQAEAHLYDVALGQERADNDFLRNQLLDLSAERDAAVQRAEAAERVANERLGFYTTRLGEISTDTERRVVEEIAEYVESMPDTLPGLGLMWRGLGEQIRAGAYRKQGARDA